MACYIIYRNEDGTWFASRINERNCVSSWCDSRHDALKIEDERASQIVAATMEERRVNPSDEIRGPVKARPVY